MPGGLGAAASRFESSSSSQLIRAHEAEWTAAGADGADRAQPMGTRVDQSFDPSSAMQQTVDEPLPEWNRGFLLLQKMGWAGNGTPLGRRAGGIVEPVRLAAQYGSLGLGKLSE